MAGPVSLCPREWVEHQEEEDESGMFEQFIRMRQEQASMTPARTSWHHLCFSAA